MSLVFSITVQIKIPQSKIIPRIGELWVPFEDLFEIPQPLSNQIYLRRDPQIGQVQSNSCFLEGIAVETINNRTFYLKLTFE